MTITDDEFDHLIDFLKAHKQDIVELPMLTVEKVDKTGPYDFRRFEPAKELKIIIKMTNPLTEIGDQTHITIY